MTAKIMDQSALSSGSAFKNLANVLINFMWKAGMFSTGIATLLIGLLYAKQESMLYFPEIGDLPRRTSSNPRYYRSPSEYQIPFESHTIRCDDGVSIHAWLLLQKDSITERSPTIIFFHGNAGNIGMRLPNAKQMYGNLKANILMVEYRGYGDSDIVKPTEVGLKLDAEAALNFVRGHAEIDPDRIFCFGRSLGGAVAFHLALYAERNRQKDGRSILAGIIVENTFLSISKMVDKLLPWVSPLKPLVLRIGWDSERIAPMVSLPVLYLAGDQDELVPFSHMKSLYEISGRSSIYARIHIIRGGTHNDSWAKGGIEYFNQFNAFISHVATRRTSSLADMESDDIRKSTVAVGMGGAEKPSGISSIPMMPSAFTGIAREVTTLRDESYEGDKKIK